MDLKLLTGPVAQESTNYGGLGAHYLDTTLNNQDKIHHVDIVSGVTETNGSVRTRAIQLAAALRREEVAENDIVLICSRCHADQTIAVLGTLILGAIVAPLDPTLNHTQCVDLIKQLKPKVCFCDLRALKQIERVVQETNMSSKLIHFGDQQNEALSFRRLLQSYKVQSNFKHCVIENPKKHVAFILPTQGTVTSPKLVCVSHHAIYTQTRIFRDLLETPDKIISYYPLCWIVQVILTCLCFEFAVVRIEPGLFTERTTAKLIQDMKIDCALLGTDLALKFVEHVAVKDFNLSCLKCVIVGTLFTDMNDMKHLKQRLPKVRFSQVYCTTETGCVMACLPENYGESLEKSGTIGKVMRNFKTRVVDINTRKDVGPEVYGELLVTGDGLMLGYLKNITLTKITMDCEYVKTGDVVKYDNEGWFYMEGRIDDLIAGPKSKISPKPLEDVIKSHPFVQGAVIIGNEKHLVACVVLKDGTNLDAQKLLTFISHRLPSEQCPTKVVFLDSFPKTAAGKIKRDVLRDELLRIKIEHSESSLRDHDTTLPELTPFVN